ncbi:patronin-like isoform X3 [Pectinophora gossypiella]|nr:patronin-like isoform X3 [Pectinophora gossypiella]
MVAMVASASGYGTLRRFLSAPDGHGVEQAGGVPSASVAVSSKQRASIKWLLSKAFNNRVPENLQEPFYRDHEDQEHLKPPIVGGLANAELYCLALANMYSDPNYHSLNHWNILQTLARKGVHVPDPPDCALTETVLIQTNPLKMGAHMSVMEALMILYAREVVTLDRVSAAAQRFGTGAPVVGGSSVPHEDGLLGWINAACTALNKAEEDTSLHVPMVKSLQELCDGTALAALISFYCPDALPRSSVRVGRMASIQDCLHNLMLVHDFCQNCLPHNVFHMMPEDVTYMRGSMRQNLIAMLADLFNMLEVHPVKSVKHPGSVPRSPSACAMRPRVAGGRSACSTPERRSCSPQREEFVVHRGRGVPTLSSVARRDDDNVSVDSNMTAAGRPSNWAESREQVFAGRRSRRSSVSDDSQLTVENFGGSQDRLHFAGRNPEKELATVANVRKISAPAGPLDSYNPPLRTSRQDIRGSIQFFHGDFQNGQDERPSQRIERQHSQPQTDTEQPYFPIRRQLSSDTITLNQNYGFNYKGGGDGFFLNDRDTTDGDPTKTSFADLNRIRSNGDQQGIQSMFNQSESDRPDRRKTSFSTPPANTTTWQQQFMQHENQPNGDDMSDDAGNSPGGGQAMAAQLNNIRLKLEEKRRRIEQEKRRMELAVNRQRQQLGQQAFLQAVTRGKGARTPADDDLKTDSPHQDMAEAQAQNVDVVALEQYQQSIAKMNSSLQDIQTDIARLASQQNQLQQQQQNQLQQQQNQLQQQQQQNQLQQQQQQQNQLQQQAKQLFQNQFQPQQPQQPYQHQQQQPYQPNIPQLHSQFSSQHNVSRPALASGFGSTPHIPQQHFYQQQQQNFQQQNYQQQQSYQPQQPQQMYEQQYQAQYRDMDEYNRQQFYLHDSPPPPQRRTWAQHAQQQQQHQQQQQTQENTELRGWQLHQQNHQQYQPQEPPRPEAAARTWKSPSPQPPADRWAPQGFVLHDRDRDRPEQPFQVHYNNDRYQNGTDNNHMSYTVINNQYSQSPPLAVSPRRSKTPQRQGSLPEASRRAEPVSLQQLHAPPPPADMEPQNISFIGNAEDDALRQGINRLNISSGTRTYRIPSPTRPSLSRNSFQQIEQEEANDANEKGFYISFDNEQPKRPKPPLRTKRGSPKKDRTPVDYQSPARSPENTWSERLPQPADEPFVVHRAAAALDHARSNDVSSERRETPPRERTLRPGAEPAAIIIGDVNIDPNSAEEMERKKERIMLLSLQRRQRADEARARAEAAAAARRARDEAAAEHKLARKEEQARRREQILYQYKLKKAMEEAEREGKVLDKSEFMESMKGGGGAAPAVAGAGARLRGKAAAARARPKTIHVDSGALHAAEGMLATKQPSSTNLTGGMRRDYYRGSQDSLAERAGLYRESPVEDRGGMSPGSASSGPLGRRGSCKTSRERVSEEPQSTRGRSKYSTYQSNFKTGRKSSSLMNLCDSGLGRATPPRRAASPGLRALGSPAGSGPGSLPGAIGKRRVHAPDDASDVSSTHSSIMDYSGPRLYKQPTTKSNRGIMLNAVEYCVFPGAVNAEAKRRVLEEIARSEAKHFLVLFRDAGCQFRALYSYCPDTEQVTKLYGTGPKHVNDRMFDKFFKYNSGSKCFSQVHTKHLTVTIDAFTIHNSLWQGKKTQLPSKKDMALVI